MASDLTILYISASMVPAGWQAFQIRCLLDAVGPAPIISVTRKPLDLGTNLPDTGPHSYWNIYVQMHRAALQATTDFVAMAEDDVLYTREHFTEFRPRLDQVSYDRARWSLFAWDPLYCMRQRISNCSLIAGREYLIQALAEREQRWPTPPPASLVGEVGRPVVDQRLRVSPRAMVEWYCSSPIVQLNHQAGHDTGAYGVDGKGRRMIKKHGQMKAYDIPVWGKATDVISRYTNGQA